MPPPVPFVSLIAKHIVSEARKGTHTIDDLVYQFNQELRAALKVCSPEWKEYAGRAKEASKRKCVYFCPKEHQVLNAIVQGKSTSEIAGDMRLKLNTVSTLRYRVARKLALEPRDAFGMKRLVDVYGIDSIPDPHKKPLNHV